MLSLLASLIEIIAIAGSGFTCIGSTYEPEIPEELLE